MDNWPVLCTGVIAVFAILGFLTPNAFAADAWCNTAKCDSNWQYRKLITIDYTKVGTDNNSGFITDFPFLVTFTGSDFTEVEANTLSNGADIRFTDQQGNDLEYEIEEYDETTNKMAIWVKSSSTGIAKHQNTLVYMYYGNPSASSTANAGLVWDSNYAAVYHMNQLTFGASSTLDSTSNNNVGTPAGDPVTVPGQIGGAVDFDGTGDQISITHDNTLNFAGTITLEGWVKTSSSAGWPMLLNKGTVNTAYLLFANAGSGNAFFRLIGPGDLEAPTSVTDDVFHHVVGTYDGNIMIIYVDGVQKNTKTVSGALGSNTSPLYLGAAGNCCPMNGVLDEIRLSNTARSADFIKTEYNNQNSPSTFYSVGSEEINANVGPTLTITTNPATPSITKTSLVYTFQFSEDVTGFTTADITLNFAGAGVGVVDGSNFATTDANTYTLTLAGQDLTDLGALSLGDTVVASVDMTGLTSISSTNPGVGTEQNTWTYDTTVPTLTITTNPTSPSTSNTSLVYTFQFSEDVTGFTSADITLNFAGAGAGAVDGSNFATIDANTYTLTLAGQDLTDLGALSSSNTVVASVDMTGLTSTSSSNAGVGTEQNTWTYDTTVTTNYAWCNTAKCDSNWQYRKLITIDYTKVGTDNNSGFITDFPFLVTFTGSDFTEVVDETLSNGADIRFIDQQGNDLEYEIEEYDETTNKMAIWVKSSSTGIAKHQNTLVYVYYGNSGASSTANAGLVWDSNYVSVWHLNDDFLDSAGSNDATNISSTDITGKIADGQSFDGNDYVDAGTDASLDVTSTFTLEAWIKPNDLTAYSTIMNKRSTSSNYPFVLLTDTRELNLFVSGGGTKSNNDVLSVNQFQHIAVTRSGANMNFYVNGVAEGSTSSAPLGISDANADFLIGATTDGTIQLLFDGVIDEVRVSSTVRSADFIKTEYNNQNSPSTFYSVSEEVYSGTTPISSGGGCDDCTPPTLGVDKDNRRIVDDGLRYNDYVLDVDLYYTPFSKETVKVGQENLLELKIYENNGPQAIKHVGVSFGLSTGQSFHGGLAMIEWDRVFDEDPKITITDPEHQLDDVRVVEDENLVKCRDDSSSEQCMVLQIYHTFRESSDFGMFSTYIWDERRNGWQNYFNHGINIIGDSLNPPDQHTVFGRQGYLHTITETSKTSAVDENGDEWYLDDSFFWKKVHYVKKEIPTGVPMQGYDRNHPYFTVYKNGQVLLAEEVLRSITYTYSFDGLFPDYIPPSTSSISYGSILDDPGSQRILKHEEMRAFERMYNEYKASGLSSEFIYAERLPEFNFGAGLPGTSSEQMMVTALMIGIISVSVGVGLYSTRKKQSYTILRT